jgi:hypothetical protein
VASEDALVAALQSAFDRPEARAVQRQRLLERFFGSTLDGQASSRVAAALLALVNT